MEYPVYEGKEQVGLLQREEQGLYSCFSLRLPPAKELSRLWLLGEERVYALGLLEPRPCGRFLRRSLSRSEARKLPEPLLCARCLPASEPMLLPRKAEEKPKETEKERGAGVLNWKPASRGCYRAWDGKSHLLAIPTQMRENDPALRFAVIQGRRYLVFRY